MGHKPDEFGLVPDEHGFITYKELLQAIHEEPGWGYVRRSYINEVLLGKDRHLFQAEDNRIRVLERRWQLDLENPSLSLPPVLYVAVRRKAHRVVMERGLKPRGEGRVVLSTDQEMALRIGRRHDQEPVLLEVMAVAAGDDGLLFYVFGDLFLSDNIPPRFISGPPVSKDVIETRGDKEAKKEKSTPGRFDSTPGTFTLEMERDPALYRRAKGKKRKGWKDDVRKFRRRT
ncbi:MAG: hypothetical protein U9N82_06765 [Thermodesulfobacteriota bacterium]|nr:hypothetical protein [Thermodesulfobacteriota bacterium]